MNPPIRPTAALAALALLGGCVSIAPEIRIADRHTVMEEDASGEWPRLEQRFGAEAVRMGPVPLAEDPLGGDRAERPFRVLNGAFVSSPEEAE